MQRLAVLLFWSAAAFALVMASLEHPPRLPGDPGDKIQHIIAFVTLAALAVLAYPRARLVAILVGLALFGGLIELVQMIPSINRDASLFDWLADMAAVGITLAVVALVRGVFSRHLAR